MIVHVGGKKIKIGEKIPKKQKIKGNIEKLTTEISEIGKNTEVSHGIMDLAQLFIEINKRRMPSDKVSVEEVQKALDKLKTQKLISIKKTKKKITLIEFTPLELTDIENKIVEKAAEKGWTNIEEVMQACKINAEVAEEQLNKLEEKDIAVVHKDPATGKKWYFRGIAKEED